MNYLEKFYHIVGKRHGDLYFQENYKGFKSNISELADEFSYEAVALLLDYNGITADDLRDFLLEDGEVSGKWQGSLADEYDKDYWWEIDALGDEVCHSIYEIKDDPNDYPEVYLKNAIPAILL